ncbi:MAG: response regulator [Bauldia sp.]
MSGTILAVDDSRTIRDLIEFVLTGAGYRTIVATDGKDALEKLGGIKPELVITDINMPKMNGYDFIRAARGIGAMQDVPILVLTTEFDEDIKSKVRELGANGWIAKPFNPTQLLETVKRVAPSAAAAA